VELHARLREESTAHERCPYCHDALGADVVHDERVVCPGCATTHHRACIAELGRCTIRGCERPISLPADAPQDVAGRHSAFYREVQRRIRERVRGFVREHCRPTDPPGGLLERRDAALRQAELAEAEGDLAAAAEWFHEAASLQRRARHGELRHGQRAQHADALAAHAARLERRAARWALLMALLKVTGAVVVLGGVIAAVVALRLVH
jgi:hypothetical protein